MSCLSLQAMVEKFSSISTRKLAKAVYILSRDKKMVAGSDSGEFHRNGKRHIMKSLLGSSALVYMAYNNIYNSRTIQFYIN